MMPEWWQAYAIHRASLKPACMSYTRPGYASATPTLPEPLAHRDEAFPEKSTKRKWLTPIHNQGHRSRLRRGRHLNPALGIPFLTQSHARGCIAGGDLPGQAEAQVIGRHNKTKRSSKAGGWDGHLTRRPSPPPKKIFTAIGFAGTGKTPPPPPHCDRDPRWYAGRCKLPLNRQGAAPVMRRKGPAAGASTNIFFVFCISFS